MKENPNIVYSPTYTSSNEGCFNWFPDEHEYQPSSYLYFDDKEYITIEDFIKDILKVIQPQVSNKISYSIFHTSDINGDIIEFSTVRGKLQIRIPIKKSPLDINRPYLYVTSMIGDKFITLNQVFQKLTQLRLEAGNIL